MIILVGKINLLQNNSKFTVTQARKTFKPKEQIIEENQKKLELIKQACKINLDKSITKQVQSNINSLKKILIKISITKYCLIILFYLIP